ncbi:hypothetical protein COCSADRAFT_147805 [Bipolaris sorokiniana ND90Pr]|uniref:Amidohydrolase-related domain-containing protein n=1 Tax=Cochliobolus sativus (strain ND90Pr / ATCC 201652) TaxID=665912 RepID=M2SZP3_COCSN|nr:uncharacterized protein COCSADRAFT_147805 [Bipolaris sorokiniana ND90Pr]EMD62242.1 hypothetical protein COCSADRAFT_147805 [Bipolaris sorokiniana ND90Pr]
MAIHSLTGTWDCHVHCFEPDKFPFKTPRAYTPRPAPVDLMLQNLLTNNVMIVQASIEASMDDLLANLEYCGKRPNHFSGLVRGTVLADASMPLSSLTDSELERMHLLGVRCIRLHGVYRGLGHDPAWAQRQMTALAQVNQVRNLGWKISAQLPLATWSQLKHFILTDKYLAGLPIVADHIACATPSDYGSLALHDFVELLQSGRVYVKISALHRRSPQNIHAMKDIISLLARAAPQALLWGSDWPHVDASQNDFEAGPLEGADPNTELAAVQSWLSTEQFQDMLVNNPYRLFGN